MGPMAQNEQAPPFRHVMLCSVRILGRWWAPTRIALLGGTAHGEGKGVGLSVIFRKCRADIEGFGYEVRVVRAGINPSPQRFMTHDSLPFNRGVLAFQFLAIRINFLKRSIPRRFQNVHFPRTKKPITHVGKQACHPWEEMDLCPSPKLARDSRSFLTAILPMNLHLKPWLLNGIRYEMVT